MSIDQQSGQSPFKFGYRKDLHTVPYKSLTVEENLHGGFAIDTRPGKGQIYYGMPGRGLLRVSADLTTQDLIELPLDLTSVNFHSTKIGEFDGKMRIFLAANDNDMVVVATLEGDIDFILRKPDFEEYLNLGNTFHPTDTLLEGKHLLVADGYGANYISVADLTKRKWLRCFGGHTNSSVIHGKYGTAHGISLVPNGKFLAVADRPYSRLEISTLNGDFFRSFPLPTGCLPCGVDYIEWENSWYAVVGSLDDPIKERPAPIYILNANTYELISTIRPKEELGVNSADHLHNVIWHKHNNMLYLICQSWNPGYYFVLNHIC